VHRFLTVTSNDSDVDDTSSRYLIFDDTTLSKTGKRIEKIGKVWDHVTNSYVLGFKLLVMMYWDGKSSIPLDFSLHREKGKKQERPFGMTKKQIRKQYSCKRIKDSYTAKRVEELDTNKIQMVLRMFFTAIYRGLRVDYVLVDSWFTCDALIQAIRMLLCKVLRLCPRNVTCCSSLWTTISNSGTSTIACSTKVKPDFFLIFGIFYCEKSSNI
jgi:hypothetical protein